MTTATQTMTINEQVAVLMSGAESGDAETTATMRAELCVRLREAEREGRPLRVYCGYDPRTSDLHLGHTITMRKLRQFQEFGHDVTFLVGSFTSLIGDPSDKDEAREQLTREQVHENARTYAEQAFKILDPQLTRVRYNDEWLSPLDFADIIRLASNFTVQQFLVRENFRKRLDTGVPIYLHELFYGLMQGYDAVAQESDVQVGGQDQLFNILVAGRKLQQSLGQKPQIALIMGELLPGTDGEAKMSKSMGNHIPLLAEPWDMFGKVMSVPDKAMPKYHKLILGYSPAQLEAMERGLQDGSEHPNEIKLRLAQEIVSIFCSPSGCRCRCASALGRGIPLRWPAAGHRRGRAARRRTRAGFAAAPGDGWQRRRGAPADEAARHSPERRGGHGRAGPGPALFAANGVAGRQASLCPPCGRRPDVSVRLTAAGQI